MSAISSQPTVRVSGPGYQGEVVAGSALEQMLRAGDVQPCFEVHSEGARVLKRESHACSAVIHRLETIELDQPMFCKQHERRGLIGLIKSLAGRHRGRIAWEMSKRLCSAGFPVPRPIGYLLIRSGVLDVRSIYYCEAMTECRPLREVISVDSPGGERERLLDALAAEIAKMHNAGIVHGDLKWTNILVDRANERFWLVDLDGAQLARSLQATMRDLARFVAAAREAGMDDSRIERLQQHYASKRGLPVEKVKRCIEPTVEAHLQRRRRIAGHAARG